MNEYIQSVAALKVGRQSAQHKVGKVRRHVSSYSICNVNIPIPGEVKHWQLVLTQVYFDVVLNCDINDKTKNYYLLQNVVTLQRKEMISF